MLAVAGYCAEDEADAGDAREVLLGNPSPEMHAIIGGVDHWREQLAAVAEK